MPVWEYWAVLVAVVSGRSHLRNLILAKASPLVAVVSGRSHLGLETVQVCFAQRAVNTLSRGSVPWPLLWLKILACAGERSEREKRAAPRARYSILANKVNYIRVGVVTKTKIRRRKTVIPRGRGHKSGRSDAAKRPFRVGGVAKSIYWQPPDRPPLAAATCNNKVAFCINLKHS